MKKIVCTTDFDVNSGGNNLNDAAEKSEDQSSNRETPKSKLNVEATNWSFDKDKIEVQSGKDVRINFKNTEGCNGISIQGTDIKGTASFTIDNLGEYTIHFTVPCGEGYAEMTVTLNVE